jgi:hypothetical protein
VYWLRHFQILSGEGQSGNVMIRKNDWCRQE